MHHLMWENQKQHKILEIIEGHIHVHTIYYKG